MSTPVNLEAKTLLARLLAGENLWVRHEKVKTASFNLVNRVLILPLWQDMSDVLYTMLIGHEIGHALWDEHQSILVFGERIDPKNTRIAAGYWNVVADARGERLTTKQYPGLRSIFVEGYKELLDRGFFGPISDPSKLCLIDRINLHFKLRQHMIIPFSKEEQVFVAKVEATLSQDDVVTVAKEIYEWAKDHNETPQTIDITELLEELMKQLQQAFDETMEDTSTAGESSPIEVQVECNSDESDGDGNGESKPEEPKPEESSKSSKKKSKSKRKPKKDDGKPESKPEDDSKSKGDDNGTDDDKNGDKSASGDPDSPSDTDGDSDDTGDNKGKSAEGDRAGDTTGDADDKKMGDENKPGDVPSTGKEAQQPVDPGPPPIASTQEHLELNLKKLIDPKAKEIVYVSVPKPNLPAILVDYKTVHAGIWAHNFVPSKNRYSSYSHHERTEQTTAEVFKRAEREFNAFRQTNEHEVNYIYQQFEMKKQAERYLRTKRHKVGSLDTLRLHAYRTEDDLFKSINIVRDGKNHGLIFIVDWSGSMTCSMAGTLEQLIVLCLFCRKANIPFRVYSLTTGGTKAFSHEPGDLVYAQNFKMRCYLSSEMGHQEFNDACVNLFTLMPGGQWKGGPTADNLIGCTPLDESVITTIELMEEFRKSTGAEVVNAVFLTDGDANTVSSYVDKNGSNAPLDAHKRFLVEDRLTRKTYDFEVSKMTPTMFRILRDRQNIRVVSFYIGGHWAGFFDNLDEAAYAELDRQFTEDGYVIATEWGCNELYITSRGDALRVKDQKIKPDDKIEKGTPEYDAAIQKAYIDYNVMLAKQHLMLNRFVLMIA